MRTGYTPTIPASVYAADRLAHRFPERPALPVPADDYVPVTELPIEQKIVLLEARGGSLARELLGHIRTWGAPEPTPSDYVEIIKRRWIRRVSKQGEADLYAVTPIGLYQATTLSRSLCKAIGIHRMDVRSGSDRYSATQWCTCGDGLGLSLNQGRLAAQASRAFAFHLEHVKKQGKAIVTGDTGTGGVL